MSDSWKRPEVVRAANAFLSQEQEAGRTYMMWPGQNPDGTQFWELVVFENRSCHRPVSRQELCPKLAEVMQANNWSEEGGIEPWIGTVGVAVTYLCEQAR